MKKLLVGSLIVAGGFMSANVLAATAEQVQNVSGSVQFGASSEMIGDMTVISGLSAGATSNGTVIASVGVINGGGYWLIGNDPNDTAATGKAPDKGWVMKSATSPTKTVRVRVDNKNRVDFQGNLGGRLWNRMAAGTRATIVIDGQQNIIAGDDYLLTVTVAKYVN